MEYSDSATELSVFTGDRTGVFTLPKKKHGNQNKNLQSKKQRKAIQENRLRLVRERERKGEREDKENIFCIHFKNVRNELCVNKK